MTYKNKTLVELKEIAKKKKIKGYYKLNKNDLLLVLSKKQKGGNVKNNNIKKNIKNFAPTTKKNLKDAIELWVNDKNQAKENYGDINNWDVSQIKDMSDLFYWDVEFNEDLNNWDVSNVTNMKNMFWNCYDFNQDLSNWDVSNVKKMDGMFAGVHHFDKSLDKWDVSNVTNMKYMFFKAASFNQPLNNWKDKVSNVTDMSDMFCGAYSFNQNLGNWNVSNVTDMKNMFMSCYDFNQPLNNWKDKVSNVTDMSGMFYQATSFNQNLGNWNVSKVTDMSYMFNDASSFNQPLNNWNVSNVTNMSGMFEGATSFNQNLGNWNVSNVTTMSGMFIGASSFNQPLSNWIVSNVADMSNMFINTKLANENNLPNWYRNNENYANNYNEVRNNNHNEHIKINKNMLYTNNNTCNQKLYKKILDTDNDILKEKKFKFEGQSGIDVGGLSRHVYDIFYKSFINKFFVDEDSDKIFINIKEDIDKNKEEFFKATEKLIILANKGQVKILINLNDDVISLFSASNYRNIITQNKNKNNKNNKKTIKSYQFIGENGNVKYVTYNLTKQNNLNTIGVDKKNYLINENVQSQNVNQSNLSNKEYESIYLHEIGFRKRSQFNLLKEWYDNFWDKYLFVTKISFEFEDFRKRIKIILPGNTSNKAINMPNNINFNKIVNDNSNNKKNSVNADQKCNTLLSCIKQHPNLIPLLSCIKESNEHRKKINAWITGSEFSNAILKIFVENKTIEGIPYRAQTCFNYMTVYKSPKNGKFKITKKYLEEEILGVVGVFEDQ